MKTWVEVVSAGYNDAAMHSHMGWQDDGSFVVADTKYYPNGGKRNIVLTEELRYTVSKLKFEPTGDIDRYRELINKAYNRPDHEEYQFTYLTGFASPLIALLDPAPMGIVFSAYSSKSGKGKSTAAKLAAGIWHSPTTVVEAEGTTDYAMYMNAGLRRNLPLVIDEITRWDPIKSGEFAYRYSSGISREQGTQNGGLRNNAHLNWTNSVTVTGNKSQHNIISLYDPECGAKLARIFEYEFRAEHEKTMSVTEGYPIISELMQMSGLVGPKFIEYVVQHRDEIRTQLQDTYARLMSAAKLSKDARFWVIGCTAAWVGFQISKKLGFHNFEARPMLNWIVTRLAEHDQIVKNAEVDYLALFGDAVSEMHSGFVVTHDRGSRTHAAKMAAGWQIPKGAITGRVVLDDGLLVMSVTQLANWCKDYRVDKSQMVAKLRAAGWMLGDSSKVARLCTGTNIIGPAVRAYEFDWHRFSGRVRLVTSDGAEITPTLVEQEEMV